MFTLSLSWNRVVTTTLCLAAIMTSGLSVGAEEPSSASAPSTLTVGHAITGKINFVSTDGVPLPDLRGLTERTLGIPATGQGTARLVGSDNRTRVSNTGQYPWRPICYLEITAGNGKTFRSTGALIGSKTVLTSGMTVYDKNNGGWARGIKVYPGRNGTSKPYGSANAIYLNTFTGWTQSSNTSDNIGTIILDSPIGKQTGWFQIKTTTDTYLTRSTKRFYAYGYPTGKSPDQTLWGMSGRVIGLQTSGTQLKVDLDVTSGQFGCPLFSDDREDGFWLVDPGWLPHVVGVMGAESNSTSPAFNVAARITSSNLKTIQGWIQ